MTHVHWHRHLCPGRQFQEGNLDKGRLMSWHELPDLGSYCYGCFESVSRVAVPNKFASPLLWLAEGATQTKLVLDPGRVAGAKEDPGWPPISQPPWPLASLCRHARDMKGDLLSQAYQHHFHFKREKREPRWRRWCRQACCDWLTSRSWPTGCFCCARDPPWQSCP